MNENEFERTARAWLEDGPTRMSDRAVRSALDEIHATRQRRAPWRPWRTSPVSMVARVAVAAVLVAAVGVLAVDVVPRFRGAPGVGASPAPIPTPTVSPSEAPSASSGDGFDIPALTTAFVSATNGFSEMRTARSGVTPATASWTPPQPLKDAHLKPGPFYDIVETGYSAAFNGTSTEIPDGVPLDEWIDQSVASAASTTTCMLPRTRQAEITIDGQPARVSEGCAGQFVATVVAGGRLYVFELVHGWDNEADARAFFDSWLATIRLTPETAARASSAPPSG
jgi:hypothetical protein